jgi:hypothetical protein
MFEKIKSNLALIAVIGIIIAATYMSYRILSSMITESETAQHELQGSNATLKKLLDEQMIITKKNEEAMQKLTIELKTAKDHTSKVIKELEQLKKPVITGPVEDPTQVSTILKTYYNDTGIFFTNDRFSICKQTTSLLVGDAVNWKVNYPIYQTTIEKSNSVISSLKTEGAVKDQIVDKQGQTIISISKTNELTQETLKNTQQQNKELGKEITAVKSKNLLQKVGIGAAALLAGWFIGNQRGH